jgi:hypothetical protein
VFGDAGKVEGGVEFIDILAAPKFEMDHKISRLSKQSIPNMNKIQND